MTAIGLLKGDLVAEDYEDDVASDPLVDQLREKMVIEEDIRYTQEYLESDKRSIANAIQILFKDGTSTDKIEVEYPIGHRRRREQGIPLLVEKQLWEPFDRAVVVDCESEKQIKRLMERDRIGEEKAKTMLLAQASRNQRLQLNDHLPTDIIENNAKVSDLKDKVEALKQKLFSLV